MQSRKKILFTILGVFSIALFLSNVSLAQTRSKITSPKKINEALGRAFVEDMLNAKSPEAFQNTAIRIIATDYIQHNPVAGGNGRQALVNFLGTLAQTFPDGHATLFDVIATNEKVVIRWNYKGTLKGALFMCAPATETNKIDIDVIDIFIVKNNQLYEHWDQIDWTRAFAQLGVKEIPAPFVQLASLPIQR